MNENNLVIYKHTNKLLNYTENLIIELTGLW